MPSEPSRPDEVQDVLVDPKRDRLLPLAHDPSLPPLKLTLARPRRRPQPRESQSSQ